MTAALPFVSLGLSFLGGMQQRNAVEAQGQAAIQQQRAQAQADVYNRQISLQNADTVKQQTTAQLETQEKQKRLRAGQAIANAGASGIGIENFEDVFRSNSAEEELDLLTIQSEGALKANQYIQQANLYGMSGQAALDQVPYIKSATRSSKAASVISGVSSGIQSYSAMKGGL